MSKLIFFDIDGTLIAEHDHNVPQSARTAIMEAQKKGHICVVNTGRCESLVGDWLQDQVPFDGYLLGCGTRITYKGEVLLQTTLSETDGMRVIEALEKHKIDAILEGTHNCYHKDIEAMYHPEFKRYAGTFLGKGFGTLEEAVGAFDKFFCYAGSRDVIDAFLAEVPGLLWAIDRGNGYFEVVPVGYSKASGMQYLAEYLGIDRKDTVAIGDSNNDLTMLEWAGMAIAMGNAVDTVKEIADYITTDVKKDGIRNALALF